MALTGDPNNLALGRAQTGTVTDYRDQIKSSENFIKIGDMTTGLGTNTAFEDYVQYYNIDFTTSKPMTPDAHGRAFSSGTVTMTTVKVITASHHKVPEILQKLWTGDKIDTIETQRTENTEGGTLRVIEKMTFTDNYFVSAKYLGDKFEMEFRTLKFVIEKTPTKQTGEQEGVVTAGFDFKLNTLDGA